MKAFRTFFLMALLLTGAMPAVAGPGTNPAAHVREFGLKTMEQLGRAIYQQDMHAARATDILFEAFGGPRGLEREDIQGWVVLKQGEGFQVRFIKETANGFAPAFDVGFDASGKGNLTRAKGGMSQVELARFRARQLAAKSIPSACSERYNTVVLDNPAGRGFLVYALAASTKPKAVMMGGHYRFFVSSDGKKLEKTDRLFQTCMTLTPATGKGGEVTGLFSTHLVSPTPLETHVFLSLSHNLPLYLGTTDGKLWLVEKGEISVVKGGDNQVCGTKRNIPAR